METFLLEVRDSETRDAFPILHDFPSYQAAAHFAAEIQENQHGAVEVGLRPLLPSHFPNETEVTQ